MLKSTVKVPITQMFRGSTKRFQLSRVKLYRKWPERKWKLLRLTGRFKLARIRVIGGQLYLRAGQLFTPWCSAGKVVLPDAGPSVDWKRVFPFRFYEYNLLNKLVHFYKSQKDNCILDELEYKCWSHNFSVHYLRWLNSVTKFTEVSNCLE